MESLSRPPHRRKHSGAPNAFSFPGRNPYEDVLVPRVGKGRALEAHEYTEIFSGSPSSIPVLDLPGVDEQVGSGDGQISLLDYSSIFGGLRNDDVAAPYEELLSGSAKRPEPRVPENSQPPMEQSGSLHSSGKTRRKSSEEVPNQSVDGVKQQFNVSFNKTNQRDSDASNGKTHIAQLHSVPGFAYFVDETPRQQKTEDHEPVPLLKRDVSRTWSFSGEVEDVKGKHGVSFGKSRMPDISDNINEANAKPHFAKVPPSSNRPSNPINSKEPKRARASNFTSKDDASKKIPAEYSLPLFDEEFDENSLAAASAAALKKAIDQAQESIRIAKLLMERKKAGHEDRSNIRPCGRLKDLDTKADNKHEVFGSKKVNSRKENVELYTEVDGKGSQPLSLNDTFPNAGNAEVETVLEKVEASTVHGEEFVWGDALSTSCSSQSNRILPGKKVQLDKIRENVEAAPIHGDATECRTAILGSEVVGNNEGMTLSMSKLAPDFGRIETGKETVAQRDRAVSHAGPEVLVEMAEKDPNTSRRMQDQEKSVEEPDQYQAPDQDKGPEVIVEPSESILNISQRTQEQAKADDRNWGISLDNKLAEEREDGMEEEKHGKKFEECEDEHNLEPLPARESAFNVFLSEPSNLMGNEVLEQEVERNPNDASDCKDNGRDEGEAKMRWKDTHLSFEIDEHLDEVMEEEINVRDLDVHPETGKEEKKVEACEPEHDKKRDHTHDGGESKSPGKLEQDKIGKRQEDSFEHEATESRFIEASNLARAQKNEAFWYVGETSSTVSGTGRSEEDYNEERHENTSEHEAEESQATDADSIDEVQKDDIVWDVSYVTERTGRSEEDHNEERHDNTSEHETNVSYVTEANNFAEVENPFWNVQETNSTLRGSGSKEHHNVFGFQEATSEEHADEAVDANAGSPSATAINETQETWGVDLNNAAQHHQKTVDTNLENGTSPAVPESQIDKDVEAAKLSHLEDNEMPGMDSLHRIVSSGIFVESKQSNASEGLASASKTENVGVTDPDYKENSSEDEHAFKTDFEIHDKAQYFADDNLSDVISSDIRNEEFDLMDERSVLEQTSESDEGSVSTCGPENIDRLSTDESEGHADSVKDMNPDKNDVVNEPEVSNEKRFTVEQTEGLYSKSQSKSTEPDKFVDVKRTEEASSNVEKNENVIETATTGEKDAKENVQNFERHEQQRRIEAIKRAREREKERLAVERAIREARERAFAEARERAEKAAAERAAAEVQQRVVTGAQEKLERAPAVKPPADKASIEAKLRAERAAVERATAEARGRALEKAKSQKPSTETRTLADKNRALKHSYSSPDLEHGTAAESAQRRKARLERHQRIMERAAKALAEKNMRDILAQKEQAERNRLAESLDADIKRWATGKEGNLRALLSTLQYILGRDSGWQPIPLTEMVTTAAVKKAYRKATLYVHPDKLQQRGASIRQKYICEKVFDLLKAAWNKFNSEER